MGPPTVVPRLVMVEFDPAKCGNKVVWEQDPSTSYGQHGAWPDHFFEDDGEAANAVLVRHKPEGCANLYFTKKPLEGIPMTAVTQHWVLEVKDGSHAFPPDFEKLFAV